jgi:hypothetical protein
MAAFGKIDTAAAVPMERPVAMHVSQRAEVPPHTGGISVILFAIVLCLVQGAWTVGLVAFLLFVLDIL